MKGLPDFSVEMLAERWKKSKKQVEIICGLYNIKVWHPNFKDVTWSKYHLKPDYYDGEMGGPWFTREVITQFEEDHTEVITIPGMEAHRFNKSLTKDRHKERCQALAEYFLCKVPGLKWDDLVKLRAMSEVGCEGVPILGEDEDKPSEFYTANQVKTWLRERLNGSRAGQPSMQRKRETAAKLKALDMDEEAHERLKDVRK